MTTNQPRYSGYVARGERKRQLRRCHSYLSKPPRSKPKREPRGTNIRYDFPKRGVNEKAQVSRVDILVEELGLDDAKDKEREKIQKILESVNLLIDRCNSQYLVFECTAGKNIGVCPNTHMVKTLYIHGEYLCLRYGWVVDKPKTIARVNENYMVHLDRVEYIEINEMNKGARLVIQSKGERMTANWSETIGIKVVERIAWSFDDIKASILRAILFNEAKHHNYRCKGINKIREILKGLDRSTLLGLSEVVEVLRADLKMRPLAQQLERELREFEATLKGEREQERPKPHRTFPEPEPWYPPTSSWKTNPELLNPWKGDPPRKKNPRWSVSKGTKESGKKVMYIIDGTTVKKVMGDAK